MFMGTKIVRLASVGAASSLLVLSSVVPALAGTKDDVRALQARMNAAEAALQAQSANTVQITELQAQIQTLTGLVEELSYKLEHSNKRLDAMATALASGFEPMPGDQAAAAAAFAATQPYAPPSSAPAGVPTGAVGGPTPLGAAPQPTQNDSEANDPAASAATGPVDLAGAPDPAMGARAPGATAPAGAAGVGAPTGAAPAPNVSVNAHTPGTIGEIALPLEANAAFEYASSFLFKGDYATAKDAFVLFLQAFPNHQRTANARFRLGEIHLALGENEDAADTFIAHIRAHPNDVQAPEAYLKLGTAFNRLQRPKEACRVFETLRSKFPNASPALLDRLKLEESRGSCA